MDSTILLALLSKKVEESIEALGQTLSEKNLHGPRGHRGHPGVDGKDFDFSAHEGTIKQWAKDFAIKFEDLSAEQIEKLKGSKGRDGRDGKDFDFSEHEETIKQWAKDFAIKFEDLSAEQIGLLRGPKGRDGKDGEGFSFEKERERITEVISSLATDLQESLKLKFEDLSDEDLEAIRGPKGRDGKSGRDFNFEDHREYFDSLKPQFSDFTDAERESLRLTFSGLTDSEKEELKLKFSDLTDTEVFKLRGAKGARGQRGSQGEQGVKGDMGPQGIRGLPGSTGVKGLTGPHGMNGVDGRDGEDGEDAPYVVDIVVEHIRSDLIEFIFEMSDGERIVTDPVKLPAPTNVYVGGGGISSGSGNSGGGTGGVGTGDGTVANPFTLLNVKKVVAGMFHTIGENLESVVTVTQQIDGTLTVDGVNTIL